MAVTSEDVVKKMEEYSRSLKVIEDCVKNGSKFNPPLSNMEYHLCCAVSKIREDVDFLLKEK